MIIIWIVFLAYDSLSNQKVYTENEEKVALKNEIGNSLNYSPNKTRATE